MLDVSTNSSIDFYLVIGMRQRRTCFSLSLHKAKSFASLFFWVQQAWRGFPLEVPSVSTATTKSLPDNTNSIFISNYILAATSVDYITSRKFHICFVYFLKKYLYKYCHVNSKVKI